MRIVLGDVELLLVSQMDLSHPGIGFLANIRDAVAGLWRLHPVRAGVVCAKEFDLAERSAAGVAPMMIHASFARKSRQGRRRCAAALPLADSLRHNLAKRFYVFRSGVFVNNWCAFAWNVSGGEGAPVKHAVQNFFHAKREPVGFGKAADFRLKTAGTQKC